MAPEKDQKDSDYSWHRNGILLPKLSWLTVRKNCSSDWEKLLKFQAEGQEFLRSLEHLFEQEKGRKVFEKEWFFNLFLDVSQIWYFGTIQFQIGKNNWDLETCRKS